MFNHSLSKSASSAGGSLDKRLANAIAASLFPDLSCAHPEVLCLVIGLHPDSLLTMSENCFCVSPALFKASAKSADI